jgi:hypothetical protein
MHQHSTQLPLEFTKTHPPKENAQGELATGKAKLEKILVSTYLKDLRSESWRVRRRGAKGLGELGTAARDAASELERLFDDPDPRVREAAGNALARVSLEKLP